MCTQGPKTHVLVSNNSKYNMNKYVAQTVLTMVMGSIPSANNIFILLRDSSPKDENCPMICSPSSHPRNILLSSFRQIHLELKGYSTPKKKKIIIHLPACRSNSIKALFVFGTQFKIFSQGGSKVRRSCQSTIVGAVCTELRHSDRTLRTAWFENGDLKKKHWVDFYHYRMDVYTFPTHIYVQTTWKVNFASDDLFKMVQSQERGDPANDVGHRRSVISGENMLVSWEPSFVYSKEKKLSPLGLYRNLPFIFLYKSSFCTSNLRQVFFFLPSLLHFCVCHFSPEITPTSSAGTPLSRERIYDYGHMVCKVLNMDIFLTQMHQFATGGLY